MSTQQPLKTPMLIQLSTSVCKRGGAPGIPNQHARLGVWYELLCPDFVFRPPPPSPSSPLLPRWAYRSSPFRSSSAAWTCIGATAPVPAAAPHTKDAGRCAVTISDGTEEMRGLPSSSSPSPLFGCAGVRRRSRLRNMSVS